MRKDTLILFILIFALGFLGLFNFNANSASAVNCASGDSFDTDTGLPCGGATDTGRKLSCVNLSSSIYCSYTSDTLVTAVPPTPLPPVLRPNPPTPPSVASSCTLSGSIKEFDMFPPEPYIGYYTSTYSFDYAGFLGNFIPYYSGSRLLRQTPFGYSVIDITNRGNPQSLVFEDYRVSPGGSIQCPGDCHGSVSGVAVSADGQRAIFSLRVSAGMSTPHGFGAMVGQPSTQGYDFYGFNLVGGGGGGEPLLQKVGDKYFAYMFSSYGGGSVRVADVTTLPRDGLAADGNGHALNFIPYSLAPSLPGGSSAHLSGYWITYTDVNGKYVYLVNASSPLPASALTAKQFTAADFGHASDRIMGVTAAQDPANPAAVYFLGQFGSATSFHYYTPDPTGYTLIRVLGGVPTIIGSINPVNPGTEEIVTPYFSRLAADNAGNLFAFMGVRISGIDGDGFYRIYTSSVREFGVKLSSFDNTTSLPNAFVAGTEPGQIYGYGEGTDGLGSVFPMTCGTSAVSYTPPPPPPPTTPPTPSTPPPPSCLTGASLGLPACTNGCYVPTPGPSGGGPSDYYKCVPNGSFTQLLKLGSTGSEVVALQKFLNTAGYDCGTADGNFGPKTQAAVIKFQIANGLVGDGVVGAQTRALLNNPPSATQACTLNISYNPTTVPYNGSLTVSYSGTNVDNSTVQYNFDNKGYAPLSPFPDSKVQSNLTSVGTHSIILKGQNSAGATCYSNTPSYTVSPATAGTCTFSPPAGLSPCTNGCYVPQPGPSGGGPLDYWKCVPN